MSLLDSIGCTSYSYQRCYDEDDIVTKIAYEILNVGTKNLEEKKCVTVTFNYCLDLKYLDKFLQNIFSFKNITGKTIRMGYFEVHNKIFIDYNKNSLDHEKL